MLHNMVTFLALEGLVVLYILIVAGPILLSACSSGGSRAGGGGGTRRSCSRARRLQACSLTRNCDRPRGRAHPRGRVFIAFALTASFLAPRWKPDFPGPNGLSVFVIASILMFVLMVLAINFFG